VLDENLLREPADRGIRLVALSLIDRARTAGAALRHASHDLPEGAGKSDDALHDFRVAVRRLRSWIRAFRPWLREDVSRKRRKRLKAIADATNAIRDATVHLEWLRDEHRRLTAPQRAGYRLLESRLSAERASGVDPALEAASDFAAMADKLAKRFDVYCEPVETDEPPPRFGAVLAERVLEESESLRASLALNEGANDVDHAHRARIAAKRLRYVAEPVSSLVDADAMIEELKLLQDSLGSLHDVHLFSTELVKASDDPGPGVLHFAERLHARGAHAYADVKRHWLGDAAAPFFDRVRRVADDLTRRAGDVPHEQ
jgi:CHAD domain-containing protein